jgi:hypothetical protein
MEQIVPDWQPEEKEALFSLLEELIKNDLLATREKHGRPAVHLIDKDFCSNFDLEFHKLSQHTGLVKRIADFISQHWLPQDRSTSLIPFSVLHVQDYTKKVLEEITLTWNIEIQEEGNIVVVGAFNSQVGQFVQDHQTQIKRVIALLGPSLQHICSTWNVQPVQYKALISQDTLEALDPDIRWHMIYH